MSELVELAHNSLLATQPLVEIAIDVHHIRDEAGYLRDTLTSGSDESSEGQVPLAGTFSETLSSSAYGFGLVVGTARSTSGRSLNRGILQASEPELVVTQMTAGKRLFEGGASPNPVFLYDGRDVLEGLVILGPPGRLPTLSEGRALREVLILIADLASRRLKCPLVSLQAPVHVPTRTYSAKHTSLGKDEWSPSTVPAVRFAIACGDVGAADRDAALTPLIDHCDSMGLTMSLSDPRPSHRAGNWFKIVQGRSTPTPNPPGENLFACYPLTFVGPARVGSTAALLDALNEFQTLSLLSCSVASLSHLAFISVQLGLSKNQYLKLINPATRVALRDLPQAKATDTIRTVLQNLNFQPIAPSPTVAANLHDKAGDYASCHGPLLRLTRTETTRPVWFSIEGGNSTQSLQVAIRALYSSVETVLAPVVESRGPRLPNGKPVGTPNLEYLLARNADGNTLSARGKLALLDTIIEELLPGQALDVAGSKICRAIEEQWGKRLAGVSPTLSVSVAWRENWLGHWLTLPGRLSG